MSAQIKGKKATFLINPVLLAEVRDLVREGPHRSMNAFVEQAIAELVRKVRRERLRQAFEEAGQDHLFLADLKEVGDAFEDSDAETLKALS
jgi:Arc/MetJ-type ribon-helix-helix transcriptional regulator